VGALYALGIGPFAPTSSPSAVGSPTPDAVTPSPFVITPSPETPTPATPSPATPSPTATVQPTASPTATPTSASPSPAEPSPGDDYARLLSHIPPEARDDCFGSTAVTPLLASAICTDSDREISTIYFLYSDAESMQQAYDVFTLGSGIEPDTGSCTDAQSWPAEGPYTIDQQPAGRALCLVGEEDGRPTIYWTDDRVNIFSWATGPAAEEEDLIQFWLNEAGPSP
jgi:hypothetical protein